MAQPIATHVYVLGFSNGTVKVGRTSNLRRRMYAHQTWARRNGTAITDQWSRRTNDANYVEWVMRFLGLFSFPRPEGSTERFEADFSEFLPKLLNDFYKWGIAVNDSTATVDRSRAGQPA